MERTAPLVLSLGGSFIFNKYKELKKLDITLKTTKKSAVLVVGGGTLCREYIKFAESCGLNSKDQHIVGIKSTIINAFIISRMFGYKFYCGKPEKVDKGGVSVMGGFYDKTRGIGNTTDVWTAIVARAVGAKTLFNISKERGVYNKDPQKNKDAKLLKSISFEELFLKTGGKMRPGASFIFDPRAAKICRSHGIKVIVTSDLKDIKRHLENKAVTGTIIA